MNKYKTKRSAMYTWLADVHPRLLTLCVALCLTTVACRQDSTTAPPTTQAELPSIEPKNQTSPKSPSDSEPEGTAQFHQLERPPDAAAAKVTVSVLSGEEREAALRNRAADNPFAITDTKVFRSTTPEDGGSPSLAARNRNSRARIKANFALGDVAQQLLKKWEGIRSLSSTITTSYEHKTHGRELRTSGDGQRDALMTGEKELIRMSLDLGIHATIDEEDPPIRATRQLLLKVFDGEFVFTRLTTDEGTTATKKYSTPGDFTAMGGPGLVAALRNVRQLKRLPDVEPDGRTMYVFTGSRATGEQVEFTIDAGTGLLSTIKTTWKGKRKSTSFAVTRHEINTGFPDGHFDFTPGKGVEIQDLTRAGANSPSAVPQP